MRYILFIASLLITGCTHLQTTNPNNQDDGLINQHHIAIATDLMSQWTTCSKTQTVSITPNQNYLDPIVRRTGRSVINTDNSAYLLHYKYVIANKEGSAFVVIASLNHQTCHVSRQYRIVHDKLTAEGVYSIIQ